jgi:hypothetical protein
MQLRTTLALGSVMLAGALAACSQGETSPGAAGGRDAALGGSGGSGAHVTPISGSASIAGSYPAAGGTGASGAATAGATTSSGGATPGASGSTGTSSGGLFGGGTGDFPTLDLPIALPDAAPAKPCPAGSVISKLSSPTLYSWPGAVFSSAPLSGQGESHAPRRLEVAVTSGDEPVAGCEVRFRAAPGQGWGHGNAKVTDAQGKLYGYWTAGQPGAATISAAIALEGGGESSVDFSGTVSDHESRTDSVHLYYDVDSSYSELKVRVTPLSAPPATYYSALNWRDSYAGIQFDGKTTIVIFSVWDAGGEKAKVADPGACNSVVDFGGEGTGTSCRLRLPPATNGSVAGLPDDYRLELGNTYELYLSMASSPSGGTAHTVTFTDLTRGIGPISLGTQTTGSAFTGGGHASAFVEEWTEHGSCLSNTRAVLYHGVRAKVGGSWRDITSASFSPNYIKSNNEVCANYLATTLEQTWLMSSGGSEYVGRPYVPGDAAFTKPQPALELP